MRWFPQSLTLPRCTLASLAAGAPSPAPPARRHCLFLQASAWKGPQLAAQPPRPSLHPPPGRARRQQTVPGRATPAQAQRRLLMPGDCRGRGPRLEGPPGCAKVECWWSCAEPRGTSPSARRPRRCRRWRTQRPPGVCGGMEWAAGGHSAMLGYPWRSPLLAPRRHCAAQSQTQRMDSRFIPGLLKPSPITVKHEPGRR